MLLSASRISVFASPFLQAPATTFSSQQAQAGASSNKRIRKCNGFFKTTLLTKKLDSLDPFPKTGKVFVAPED